MAMIHFGKRGILFTLMAIVISSVLVLSAELLVPQSSVDDNAAVLLRVRIVDGVITSFLSFSEQALAESTHDALNNLTDILASVEDPDLLVFFSSEEQFVKDLGECISGTAEVGHDYFPWYSGDCLVNTAFPTLLENFSSLVSDTMAVEISFSPDWNTFVIAETSAFEAQVNLSMNITVIDAFANWSIVNHNLSVDFSLEGVKDPLLAKAGSRVDFAGPTFQNFIFERSPVTVWNETGLLSLINNQEYRFAPGDAPSILGRYYGDFSYSECCGVETVVRFTTLNPGPWSDAARSLSLHDNYSAVDHQLFVSQSGVAFEPEIFSCSRSGPDASRSYPFLLSDGSSTDGAVSLDQSRLSFYGILSSNWDPCS